MYAFGGNRICSLVYSVYLLFLLFPFPANCSPMKFLIQYSKSKSHTFTIENSSFRIDYSHLQLKALRVRRVTSLILGMPVNHRFSEWTILIDLISSLLSLSLSTLNSEHSRVNALPAVTFVALPQFKVFLSVLVNSQLLLRKFYLFSDHFAFL